MSVNNIIQGIVDDKNYLKKNYEPDEHIKPIIPPPPDWLKFKSETSIIKSKVFDNLHNYLWGDINNKGILWGDINNLGFVWGGGWYANEPSVIRVVNNNDLFFDRNNKLFDELKTLNTLSLLSGWAYYREITITNPTSTVLVDYQVKIVLDSSNFDFSKANPDGSDVRFTKDDGQTQLNYWIEDWCSTSETGIVWVKIPLIPANTTTTIRMYYGNPLATSESNAYKTFIRVMKGIVGDWCLDEGSGTVIHDSSGNKNDGVINDGVWVDGKFGKSLEFNGNNTQGIIDNNQSLNLNKLTVTAWIYPYSAGENNYGRILNKKHQYLLYMNKNKGVKFRVFINGNAYDAVGDCSFNTWSFVVGVYDGEKVKVYVDGVEYEGDSISGELDTTTYGLYIGNNIDNTRTFDGKIDEVKIFNRALSKEEILDLYNNYGFSTLNYPKKVLVRKYSSQELTINVGSEVENLKDYWSYVKTINISNSLNITLTDYPIKIILNNSNFDFSKTKNDGGDIRFVDTDGETLLDYYIEEYDSTNERAIIWVKVPSINPNSNKTIYLIYGNPNAESESNGNAVFDFFDDFDNGLDSNVWSSTCPSEISVSNGIIRVNKGTVYTKSTIGSTPQNYTFEIKAKYYTQEDYYSGLMISNSPYTQGGNAGSDALVYLMSAFDSNPYLQMWGADGTSASYNIIWGTNLYDSLINNHYYIFGFTFVGDSQITFFIKETDYTNLSTISCSGTWDYPYYLWFGYFSGNASMCIDGDDLEVDWVRVRKYVSEEPTVVIGEEKTSINTNLEFIVFKNNLPYYSQAIINWDDTFNSWLNTHNYLVQLFNGNEWVVVNRGEKIIFNNALNEVKLRFCVPNCEKETINYDWFSVQLIK